VNLRKYIILAGVTLFAAAGDSLLSHGMKQLGSISINHLHTVIFAILDPGWPPELSFYLPFLPRT